nr:saccharopine dehydrogenase [Actinomycetota bacterium]
TEQRVPIVPADAARLVAVGARITVEESAQRVFAQADYRRAGCEVVPAGVWEHAPADAYVVGIKELPPEPVTLRHTHIFFAHAFKGQRGAGELLARFGQGGGELLDVEYLTVAGHRSVAFGHWAGYVGAGLAVLQHRRELVAPLAPMTQPDLDARLGAPHTAGVQALVIGARGRSGRGAEAALRRAGCAVTQWGMKDTRLLDKAALLNHDLLVNCVVTSRPQQPFVEAVDAQASGRRLSVIADVTCDVTSGHNLLPVNTAVTTWDDPARRVHDGPVPLDVIAIDNLPSLLPREASIAFSADFVPLLDDLAARRGPWVKARAAFERAVAASTLDQPTGADL